MCARWANLKGFDPAVFIDDLAKNVKVDGDAVSFGGRWWFEDVYGILTERFEFHPEIANADRAGMVWRSIVEAAKAGQLSLEGVEKFAATAEIEYLRKPITDYVLHSSVSVDRGIKIDDVEIDGCRIRYYAYRESPPAIDVKPIATDMRVMFDGRPKPTNYTPCTVDVRSRTPTGAGEKALDAASLSRALMNLWENLHLGTRSFSGRARPVNSILPGPMTTLHKPDGTLAMESFWYEPSYVQPASTCRIRRPDRFRRMRKSWLLRLKAHPFADVVRDAVIRYNSALDKVDYDAAIIELWAVLEALAGIENAKYDDLIKRVSFVYEDTAWIRAVLSHLREYRNRAIHSGRSSDHRNEAIHMIRRIAQGMLMFHWDNRSGAASFNEAVEFLSLDPNVDRLTQRRDVIDRAVRFLTPKDKPGRTGDK